MDKSVKYKIALIIKTDGLEYDDRVRKEILTIQELFPNISFKIFAMLPENKEVEGVTGYGVPFKTVFIPAREKYPSARKPILKAYQFYKVLKYDLRDYDAIWAANIDTSIFPLLVKNDKILWDLHELPTRYMGNWCKKLILRYVFSKCKVVVHANPQRANYLKDIGVVTEPNKHYAIRNYPNFNDVEKDTDEVYEDFVIWKNERKCVYLQGLNNDSRAAYESIKSVLNFPEFCCVVVGGFDENSKAKLENEFGDSLNERVKFIGKVAQLRIPHYVKQCYMSLIFYKNVRPNNYYCEANRFYQSVLMGLPVVVGSNPPMRDLVNQYGLGVSINDDGRDVQKIIEGIKSVLDNYDYYKQNIEKNKDKLEWKNQEADIKEIVNALFS